MGWAQADGGSFDEAIVRTNRYLEKNQDDSDTIYSLAGLFFLQGSLHEAENELIKLDALYADGENGEKMRRVEEMRFLIKKRKETTHVK